MSRSPAFSRLRALARRVTRPDAGQLVIDRRRFVQLAVGAVATTQVAACSKARGRVIVVGGGVAGLHCAYRLADAGVDVHLYEASERVGGRMFTAHGKFGDNQLCELGGELIDSNHITLWTLAEELDITFDDRWADDKPGMARDLWWVNGASIPDEEIVRQYKEVAPIFNAELMAAESSDDDFARLDQISLIEFLDEHVPPSRYPELHSVLDNSYRGEYGLENDKQSCLNLLYLIDSETPDPFRIFADSDERWHTRGGNELFPMKLAERIGDDRITLNAALVSVRQKGKKYILTFQSKDGSEIEEQAEHVVFALPFTKLRQVELDVKMKPFKRRIIRELSYGTNAKVMGGFKRRVWYHDYNDTGTTTTDMPLQQTWDTSVGQAGETGILTNFLGGDQGVVCGEGTAEDWFQSRLDDLEAIWPGMKEAYVPGSAVRMHWPSAPWQRGSYTCYTIGQWDFWSFEGRREGNLHFCGEHTSLDFQGWMEGAAETGGLVAAEILDDMGIPRGEKLNKVVAPKLLMPQATYHGDIVGRIRWSHRRRQGWSRIQRLVG